MPPFDDDAVARRVLAERAYGGIYSSQYADAAKSAHSNEMAKRLGIDPQVVESDYPNMMAEDRLRRATQAANASPHYAGMMANPRFAAAAIDDKSIHPLADAVAAHQDRQANRPTKGGFLAGFQAVDSYLGSAFNSGLYSAAAVAGNVASSMERGFGQVKDVGRLLSDPFGNDKKLQMQTLVAPTKSTPLTRFAENMQRASQKAAVSNKYYDDLTYGASDPSKSAFLSPIRMVHDVLQSLPTSSAFVAIGVLTKGANLSAIAAAEARGLAPEIAKQLGIRAAVKMATMTGAVGEGIVGGAQQEVQTRVQVLDDPKLAETSPLYKMLIKSGINADDARQYIATQAGSDAGLAAGAVDAITNIASGPILGRIIGEGGPVLQRALKGFLTEGTQEAVQGAGEQVGQNAALKEYVDPHQSLVDGVVENMLASFAVGGLSGGGMTAALGHASEAEHATAAASDVDKVMSMAAQSTTRTANPTDFQTVLAQALEGRPGENLYIPADKVTELFQDTSITDDAFWGQYANQLEQAHAIGGDVVIPLSEAATHLAGSPQWQQLREHVRATPGGMSLIEAKNPQTTEELEAAANGLAEHIDRVAPQLEAGRAVKDFVGTILPAGEQADKATQLFGANLAVQTANENQKRAARGETPITPTEMFKRWKLRGETTTEATEAERTAHAADVVSEAAQGKFRLSQGGEGETLDQIGYAAEDDSVRLNLEERGDTLHLHLIDTTLAGRGQGIGTAYMKRLAAWADAHGKRIVLTPEAGMGATSRGRLVKFYKRFGFTENKGRKADHSVSAGMIREPDTRILNSGKRGAISISHDPAGNMTSAVIRAFETANFSTFVHEMGHFWLEDLRMRAVASDATEQERADWQTVQDWFFDNGHDASQSIPTDAHEMWARGTERYIYEGKAPSRSLGALFARMRDWMQELYHSVSAFNSPISPEIREVMDRMFASDNEIQQQQDALALASAHVEGLMTDAELAEYRKLSDDARTDARDELYASVLSTLKREKQAERSARTKEVKADVTEQVDAEPIFTALNILRTGIPDGEQRQRARLSKQWLIDTYGKDILDTMPKGVTPIIADTDTMDAEQIAEMAGFVSADQMIKALQAHERQRQGMKNSGDKRSPRQASIEEGTTQRIRDEMGDPFANLEEEAQAALSNDRQAEAMSMELRALARKTANRPTPWKMATTWAASHIAQTRVRDSISGSALQMYARNAGKAGRSGEDALVKGNFDEAFQYKQQQMLNLALLSEGKKIKDRVEKAVRKMHDIAGKKTIKSVDQDYLDQAHQLLEGVDLKERPLTRVDKRQQFEAWYADQVAQGIEPIVPPEYRHILGTTNFKNITNDELLQLGDVVSQIMKLGRLKQRLIDGKDERDFHEAAAEMRAVAEDQLQRKRSGANDPARVKLLGVIPSERIKSGLRSFDAALIKLETIIDWMDDGDPNGPWNRMILRPLSNSQGQEADMLRDYAKEVNEHIKAVPREQARRWARWVDTPELINNIPGHPERGTPMQFGMDQVVMMAMNWGNEGSRQRLVDGFGWDEDVVKGVLDRLMTKEDWDFTQNIWNTVNTLWPAMAEMERRVNGVAPPKVEAVSIDTPHGTYEGGYFPAIYDPTYSTTAQLQEQDKLSPNGGFFKATTRAGSTHERVAAVKGRPLLLNLGVITRHMSEVIHDISHREAIQQVTRLLADKGIRTAVDNALGPEYLKTMERVVDNIARPGVANSKSHPALVNIARRLNKGVSVVGMGFRVSTILQQPLGLANMIGEVGERAVMEGMAVSIAHPVRTYNEVTTRSAEMRHRFSNMDATIHEMWESQKAGKLAVMGPAGIEKAAFQGIAYADAMITTGGWIGAYNKALREGMADDDAVHYADKAIRRSQGAGGAKDQSPVQFDHAFVRAFVPFFSYLNANYNQRRDVGHKLRRAEGAGDYARVAKQYWWVAIVPAMMQALLFGQGPDDDTPEGWAEYLGIQQMLGGLATIPGIGPLANSLGNGYGYRATPWQQFGENIGKTTHDVKASLDGNDDTEVSKSWIKNSMYVAGVATSKPLGQLGATAQGVHDYATGEADPQTSGDWYNLLTKGSIPQKH